MNITGTAGNDTLNGTASNDTIDGLAGNDTLNGLGGNDSISGGDGNDIINPGLGADIVDGGAGTDVLVVNYSTSSTALASSGSFTSPTIVNGSLVTSDPDNPARPGRFFDDYPLTGFFPGQQVQINLDASFDTYLQLIDADTGTVLASDDDSGEGVNSALTFTVEAGVNYIIRATSYSSGATGSYTLTYQSAGGPSLPFIQSGSNSVTYSNIEHLNVTGTAFNDDLRGGSGRDTLNGGAGNDTLDGAGGADVLNGQTGDDTYIVNNTGDRVTEATGAGSDTVNSSVTYSLGANVENLTLTGSAAISGTGNALNNVIAGNSANNTLSGAGGNDTYIVNNTGDRVIEAANAGSDTVNSSVTYSLGANVENLTLTGSAAINGTGNALNNVIASNSADNTLSGGGGNDTYIVNNTGDRVIEAANGGSDTVNSSVTYSLAANVENLTLTGSAAISGTGNTLNNVITGNSANNVLDGGAGIDRLVGGLGDDTYIVNSTTDTLAEASGAGIDTVESSASFALGANLENLALTGAANINGTGNALNNIISGNSGNNTLSGGAGDDNLDGGAGNDTFIATGGGNDFIRDSAGIDTLNASAAQSGSFINLEAGSTSSIDGGTVTLGSGGLIVGARPDVVFVIDKSGSTSDPFGGTPVGDVNGDGSSNTILDAEIAGFIELNQDLINRGFGSSADVAIVSFDSFASQVGAVLAPSTDNDNDGVPDIEELLASINEGGDTNFEVALQTAEDIFTALGTTPGNGNLIFLSDGFPTAGGSFDDEVASLEGLGVNLRAFGAGTSASLTSLQIIDSQAEIFTTTDELLNVFSGIGSGGSSSGGASVENAIGNQFNDTILGNDADNTLIGGGGNDSLSGEEGNDALNGDAGNDSLLGDSGNDTLNGGAGSDTLIGGLGDDTYIVDTAIDVIREAPNSGNDTVQSSVTFTLAANLENLTLTGTGAINGTGNTLSNTITGNGGANTLTGGAGSDTLIGGLGNDTYIVESAFDIVTEASNAGTDTVQSSVSWTLGANLENLTLTGTSAINGTGNTLNNTITGNAANNILSGGAGNDTLTGNAGRDTLSGGLGNDTLNLGLNDNAVDTVLYNNGNGSDIVNQFSRTAGDLIGFTGIASIDIRTVGSNTEFRRGDGISSNAGFGTGELLVSLVGVTGFSAANIGNNDAASNTAQFLFS